MCSSDLQIERYEMVTTALLTTDLRLWRSESQRNSPEGVAGWRVTMHGDSLETTFVHEDEEWSSTTVLDTIPVPVEAIPLWLATFVRPRPGNSSEIGTLDLASLDSVLAEPIADVLATDAAGRPCIEVKTTLDLEHALRMPGGNIFHGPLSWPWAEDDAPLATPAERWGVATAHPRILLCGSGAVRGGAVSGIGGHNAAMAVLEAAED